VLTVHEILRARLLRRCGMGDPPPSIAEITSQQWDEGFAVLMRSRLVMSFFRRGAHRGQLIPPYANVSCAIRRLGAYLADGNREHLVDAANLCMVEWIRGPLGMGEHQNPCWNSVDDGEHTPEVAP
jgi:hypothetical protein